MSPTPPPLTFAIGDIHGCLDKLQRLLATCEARAAGRPARFVFLGDYVDRGPDSGGVVELLLRRQQQGPPGAVGCLRGKHEQMASAPCRCGCRTAAPPRSATMGAPMAASRMPISNGCARCRSATTTGCASSCM